MACSKCCTPCTSLCTEGVPAGKSCLLLEVAGVTGSGTSSCTYDCAEVFNGQHILKWNNNSGSYCEWRSRAHVECPVCGTLTITAWTAVGGFSPGAFIQMQYSKPFAPLLMFKKAIIDYPTKCNFEAVSWPYDATESQPDICDFSGATATLTALPPGDLRCVYLNRAGSFCKRGYIPYNGLEVELSGFANGTCGTCTNVNGIYLFNSAPTLVTSPGFEGGELTGWQYDLAACPGATGEVTKLYVREDATIALVGPGVGGSPTTKAKWNTANCLCSEFNNEVLTYVSGWTGCDLTGATVTVNAL